MDYSKDKINIEKEKIKLIKSKNKFLNIKSKFVLKKIFDYVHKKISL